MEPIGIARPVGGTAGAEFWTKDCPAGAAVPNQHKKGRSGDRCGLEL
jgi:hypothetical protein